MRPYSVRWTTTERHVFPDRRYDDLTREEAESLAREQRARGYLNVRVTGPESGRCDKCGATLGIGRTAHERCD